MNSPALQRRSPVRGDVTSAARVRSSWLLLRYRALALPSAWRKKERKKEVAEVSYKITRENNKEGRGITAISLDRHRSRLIVYYILKRGTIFLFAHGVFFQLSLDSIQSDIIVYSQSPADCVGLNRISASMDARLIQLIRFFGEYFCPGCEEHQLNEMTYVNKWAAIPRKVYWTPNNRHNLL